MSCRRLLRVLCLPDLLVSHSPTWLSWFLATAWCFFVWGFPVVKSGGPTPSVDNPAVGFSSLMAAAEVCFARLGCESLLGEFATDRRGFGDLIKGRLSASGYPHLRVTRPARFLLWRVAGIVRQDSLNACVVKSLYWGNLMATRGRMEEGGSRGSGLPFCPTM